MSSSNTKIILHGDFFWISPYFLSSFVALKEKGLDFVVEEIPLQEKAQLKDDYANSSITGRIPSIRDGEFWLAESSAIAEYLEDQYPPPKYGQLMPLQLQNRARARQLMAWLRSDLLALREDRGTHTIFYPDQRTSVPLSSKAEENVKRLIRVAEQMIPKNTVTPFLFENQYSLVDSELALMLQRLLANGHELPALVRVYAEYQWSRPSVRQFVEHHRPAYVPYY